MATDGARLIRELKRIGLPSFESNEERLQAKSTLESLLVEIESPWETVFRLGWAEPALIAALKILIDVDLFSKWKHAGNNPESSTRLAAMVAVSETLLQRLLFHCAAMGVFTLNDDAKYKPSTFALSLANPTIAGAITLLVEFNMPAFLNLSKFLRDTNYTSFSHEQHYGNWQHLRRSQETPFEFMTANPPIFDAFQNAMKAYGSSKVPWTEIYPVGDLVKDYHPDKPLVVDLGGGDGHDLEFLIKHFPSLPKGSLVLQEIPGAVDETSVHPLIQVHHHSCFEPQPVKGARVYYLHLLIHGFQDHEAVKILQHLSEALERGYSKILIHEIVLGDNMPVQVTASDITMMAIHSGSERTYARWESIIKEAGLTISHIWQTPTSFESILQVELAI